MQAEHFTDVFVLNFTPPSVNHRSMTLQGTPPQHAVFCAMLGSRWPSLPVADSGVGRSSSGPSPDPQCHPPGSLELKGWVCTQNPADTAPSPPREEYGKLFDFVNAKKLNIKNRGLKEVPGWALELFLTLLPGRGGLRHPAFSHSLLSSYPYRKKRRV